MVLVGEKPDPSIKTTGFDPTGSYRQQLYHGDSPAINESVDLLSFGPTSSLCEKK